MSDLNRAASVLLKPYQDGMLDWPQHPVLFLNASRPDNLPANLSGLVCAIQPDRGRWLELHDTGINVQTGLPPETDHRHHWMLVARQNEENGFYLNEIAERSMDDATVVIAGEKGGGIEKLIKRLGQSIKFDGKISKSHCIVFWFRVTKETRNALLEAAIQLGGKENASVGVFNRGEIDAGTGFLIETLPEGIHGAVADLGAGAGHIALAIAKRSRPAILDLYESHHGALELARHRLADIEPPTRLGFHWHDVITEPISRRYDVIVTNPPFHDLSGRTDPRYGLRFLQAGLAALRPRGRLIAVANRDLPYEQPLRAAGFVVDVFAANTRFKCLDVRRR